MGQGAPPAGPRPRPAVSRLGQGRSIVTEHFWLGHTRAGVGPGRARWRRGRAPICAESEQPQDDRPLTQRSLGRDTRAMGKADSACGLEEVTRPSGAEWPRPSNGPWLVLIGVRGASVPSGRPTASPSSQEPRRDSSAGLWTGPLLSESPRSMAPSLPQCDVLTVQGVWTLRPLSGCCSCG